MLRQALPKLCTLVVALWAEQLLAQEPSKPASSSSPVTMLTTAELLSRFETAEYAWQQTEIATQLVNRGDLSVLPKIEELSRVSDRKRRCNAAFVLDGLGDERGLAILVAEVRDTGPRAAIASEARGNNPAAHQVVSDRYHAANLLGTIGHAHAVPSLVELLKDEQLAYVAAGSLGRLGIHRAIPDIVEMADRFPQHRDDAAAALAQLGDQRGLDMLVEAVGSRQEYGARCRAIHAIQESGSAKQQPVLLKALEDSHPNVRVAAARALKVVGDSQSLPALRKAATDRTVPPWHAPTTVSAEAIAAIKSIEIRVK